MNKTERCVDMSPNMAEPNLWMHHEKGGHHGEWPTHIPQHFHTEMNLNMMPHHDAGNCHTTLPGLECEPITHCPIEKVCHRQIHHQVKHIQPVHTRIINHHIYNHSCVPHFTCSEENVVCHTGHPCCKPFV